MPVIAPTLICIAYAVLLFSWALANAPFTAPDEVSHYVRAIGAGSGQIIGRPAAFPVPVNPSPQIKTEYTWINEATRAIDMPANLMAANLGCNGGNPNLSAACLAHVKRIHTASTQLTPVGNYQPLPYLLPGILIRLGGDPLQGDRLGRIGDAFECFLFLALAVWLLWGGVPVSLIGILATITPMVLFIGASVTPSGLEIASGIAFAAALLRLRRDAHASMFTWAAVAVTGAVLCLSRAPGPLWVLLDLLVFIGLDGLRGTIRRVRSAPVPSAAALSTLFIGALLSRIYERAYGSRLAPGLGAVEQQLGHGFDHLPVVLNEEVGVFGSLDCAMPIGAYRTWLGMVVAMILVAMIIASWRERLVLAAAVFGGLLAHIIFSAFMVAGTTFDVQGRHMLPIVTMVPVLAGELIFRERARLFPWVSHVGFTVVACGVATFQLGAWYWSARRQAVSAIGPLNFIAQAQWSPPQGWLLWVTVTCLGTVLLALPALLLILELLPLPRNMHPAASPRRA